MPDVPDSGLVAYARYFIAAVHSRYQRRAAVRALADEIQADVGQLDGVLGALGRAARALGLESRPLADENHAIDEASRRAEQATAARADVAKRIAEELARHRSVAAELAEKLAAAEKEDAEAASELERLEDERSAARERRKELEKKQKAYLKGADAREAQAQKSDIGDQRAALRRSAEDMRGDAARLEPERADVARIVTELDEKVARATTRASVARAARDATRKALDDAGAGHRHRHAELQADEARQARATADADAEVARRMVTLGTLLNLNRVGAAELDPLYIRVDALKATVAAREQDVERLESERRQIDRGAVIRGAAVLGGALVLLITVVCVLVAVL